MNVSCVIVIVSLYIALIFLSKDIKLSAYVVLSGLYMSYIYIVWIVLLSADKFFYLMLSLFLMPFYGAMLYRNIKPLRLNTLRSNFDILSLSRIYFALYIRYIIYKAYELNLLTNINVNLIHYSVLLIILLALFK